MTIRTTPPDFYIPPLKEDMKEMAKKVGIKAFSADIVLDLCHLAAGGEIKPPSGYRDEILADLEKKFPASDKNGKWELSNGRKTESRQEAFDSSLQKTMNYHQNVCDFLQTLRFEKIIGDSPLEKAMSLLKLLSQKNGGTPSGEAGEEDTLPIFSDCKSPEKIGEEINRIMDEVESLSEEEKGLLGEGQDSEGEENLKSLKIAEDFINGKEAMLLISRNLDKLSRMKVRRSRKVEPDIAGDEVRQRPIDHMGEINKMVKSEWALPSTYRTYRIVTHASPVRERVKRIEKKQLLYIIIDCSGSMKGNRIYKAGGVLMNRLKAVIADEAELYIALFDEKLHQDEHIVSPVEAKQMMEKYIHGNNSGRGTDISSCAREAQKRIDKIVLENKSVYRPELVIVTDGEDKIDLNPKEFLSTKVHAFVVEKENKGLTDFAVKTGGVGINNI